MITFAKPAVSVHWGRYLGYGEITIFLGPFSVGMESVTTQGNLQIFHKTNDWIAQTIPLDIIIGVSRVYVKDIC